MKNDLALLSPLMECQKKLLIISYKRSKEVKESLDKIGADEQLATVDLQNALQRSQQTLQTMSNISKTLHDTAMAIIRKLGE